MLRLIAGLLAAALFLILFLPVLAVLALIGIKRPDVRERICRKLVNGEFRVISAVCGAHITVRGAENISSGSALYVGNHRSIFDIILVYPLLPAHTGFIAKGSLEKAPLLPIWAKFIGCLFFDRSDLRAGLKMIQTATEMVQNGWNIMIFPEGTRKRGPEELPLQEMHEGSFRIAMKSGCPIIPMAIHNTAAVWEGHLPWVRKADVVITFGEPILPADIPREDRKHVGQLVSAKLTEMLQEVQ